VAWESFLLLSDISWVLHQLSFPIMNLSIGVKPSDPCHMVANAWSEKSMPRPLAASLNLSNCCRRSSKLLSKPAQRRLWRLCSSRFFFVRTGNNTRSWLASFGLWFVSAPTVWRVWLWDFSAWGTRGQRSAGLKKKMWVLHRYGLAQIEQIRWLNTAVPHMAAS